MKKIFWLLILSALYNCSEPNKSKKTRAQKDSTQTEKNKANGLIKSFTSDGKLYSAVNYKDGIKNGISYAYYTNGQVNLELTYVNGKREGQSKRYYENGKLFQTSEYRNDNLNGFQKKYRENGNPISEMKFENDEPCAGLKEYLMDGSLKKDFPQIVITPIDEIKTKGRYTLHIAMSNKTRNVKFYEGMLTPTGCFHGGLNFLLLNEKTGVGEIVYNLPPGGFLMKELNIIAKVRTLQGNTYIAQKSFNLSIDN